MEKNAIGIKLLFLDVDGVLTDGRVTFNAQGEEFKSFHVKDGQGLKMLMRAGVEVIIVSGRRSPALVHRTNELGIAGLFQGVADKKALCRRLRKEKGLSRHQVAGMGDDLPDLAMFSESGFCIAVADSAEEVRGAADLITKNKGGHGAVREACEWIMKCQGKWDDVLQTHPAK